MKKNLSATRLLERSKMEAKAKPAPGIHKRLQSRHRKPNVIYGVEEANDRFLDHFKNHGLEFVTHEQRHKLAEFYVLLMENQKVNNFTRLVTLKDVAIKHFVDSLYLTKFTQFQFPLLDVGTGPGFPGIPLKILFPNEKIFLAEKVAKRVEFLKLVREKLALSQLEIFGREINPDFHYPMSGVITRAFSSVNETLAQVQNCTARGAKIYLMKGPGVDEEIREFKISNLGETYELIEDHPYTLPNTPNDRRLLVFEKQ